MRMCVNSFPPTPVFPNHVSSLPRKVLIMEGMQVGRVAASFLGGRVSSFLGTSVKEKVSIGVG